MVLEGTDYLFHKQLRSHNGKLQTSLEEKRFQLFGYLNESCNVLFGIRFQLVSTVLRVRQSIFFGETADNILKLVHKGQELRDLNINKS